MKFCPKCGYAVDDGDNFCKKCGAHVQTPDHTDRNGTYGQMTVNTRSQSTAQTAVSWDDGGKSGSKGKTVGLIFLVLLVLGGIGVMFGRNLGEKTSGDEPGSTVSDPTREGSHASAYSKGAIVAGRYVNDWAGISFNTSGWTQGSAEEYDSYEDEKTECGVVLHEDTGNQLVIAFEKLLGDNAALSEEEYLKIMGDRVKAELDASGSAFSQSPCGDKEIAGKTYKRVVYSFDGSELVREYYVRKFDGYMICIVITAESDHDVSAILYKIKASGAVLPEDDPPTPTAPAEEPSQSQGGLAYTDGRVPNYPGTDPQWETVRFEWPRQDGLGSLRMELPLDTQMYIYYRGLERYQGTENYHYYTDDANNRAIVAEIVRAIRQVSGELNYSDAAVVREVANFVQNVIEYQYDSDSTGEEEYPRYPIETLFERRGDCEDTSILMAALLRELGYEVGFLQIPGHVAVALRTSDEYSDGMYYEINGHRYLYIESTATGWNIGDIPDEFLNTPVTYYALQ